MSNIDKQTVQAVADLKAGYTLGHADVELIQQMALDAVTLLDELEAKDKRNAELEDLLEAEIKSWMQRYDSANNRRESAEKRIAELEALDKPKFVQCWSCKHDIEVLAIADCDGYCPRCAAPIDLDDKPCVGISIKGSE